ncbi:MAG: NAD(P)H-binding protein [Proteobacteria bacterium]|nr:NAD(P)H-binding protein [Pseudomonadota bacterium]
MKIAVLGITGGVGGAVADAFLARGWGVVALARTPSKVHPRPNLRVVQGDANDADALDRAIAGCSLVFHGVNLPYTEWDPHMVTLTAEVIAATERAGATLLFPGNVYGLGPDFTEALGEDDSHEAPSAKGVIRNRIEAMLAASSARSIVLRMGDFFGGQGESTWVHELLNRTRNGGALRYPGPMDVEHAWTYLPDAAETFVLLAERRDELEHHAVFHFAGHVLTGTEWAQGTLAAIGERPVRPFPWMWFQLARPFVPFVREIFAMRYLWDQPVRMRQDKLEALLGEVPHTPFDVAITRAARMVLDEEAVAA